MRGGRRGRGKEVYTTVVKMLRKSLDIFSRQPNKHYNSNICSTVVSPNITQGKVQKTAEILQE